MAGFAGRNRAWVDAFHRRHFDLNVDAVEDRPRQAAEVLDTVFFPARAALAVAVCVAAGARIGRHDQLESCRIVGGVCRVRAENSGASSMNRMPRCARVIAPG